MSDELPKTAVIRVADKPFSVRIRADYTMIVNDDQGKAYIHIVPKYTEGTGPVLEFHKVMGGSIGGLGTAYLMTLRMPAVNAIIRKLPVVMSAASRLARRPPRQESGQGA